MKKLYKYLTYFLFIFIATITPLLSFKYVGLAQRPLYQKTYSAALVDKVNYLKENQNKKKIVLIGGSNVAFGFNSELLEKEYKDYKVINFGLYASLGTKLMLELSLPYIKPNDMVFIIPEVSSQTMSLYINPRTALEALETNMKLYHDLSKETQKYINSDYLKFVIDKANYYGEINPSGVYQRQNFNSYYDVEYLKRDENNNVILDENNNPISLKTFNKMSAHYLPGSTINFNNVKPDNAFFDCLNEYNKMIKNKGATTYFSFPPINSLACQNTKEDIINYYWNIRKHLDFKVIGNPYDYLIDPHYFYDTNFHLNDVGAILRTYKFILDVNREIYFTDNLPSFTLPPMPEYPKVDLLAAEDSLSAKYFDYEEIKDNDEVIGYSLKSIKDSIDEFEIMRLPEIVNHHYVLGLSKECFKNADKLKTIIIPSTYTYITNKAFDNSHIKGIYLEHLDPSNILVDYTGNLLSDAAKKKISFYVDPNVLSLFKIDYNWSAYKDNLKGGKYEKNH